MRSTYNNDATVELKNLLSNSPEFTQEMAKKVIKLVKKGANPNIRKAGIPLLHLFLPLEDGIKYITTLVKELGADIDIQDRTRKQEGFTLLRKAMDCNKSELFMPIVRLGANVHIRDCFNKSLSDIFTSKTDKEELEKYTKKYDKNVINAQQDRNNYINLLLLLVKKYDSGANINSKKTSLDFPNFSNKPLFKSLTTEFMLHILSFLNFKKMGKTKEQGIALAKMFFTQSTQVQEMLKAHAPGGINVYEDLDAEINEQEFTLFNSAVVYAKDYDEMYQKSDIKKSGKAVLDTIKGNLQGSSIAKWIDRKDDKQALKIWEDHLRLFKMASNRVKLFRQVEKLKPYSDPEMQEKILNKMVRPQ